MAHTTLILPETVSLPQLVEWNNQLWNPTNELEIRIDFGYTRFFTPFAMMFIIHQIENYKNRFNAAVIVLTNFSHLSWPERMGFFSTLSQYTLGDRSIEQADADE
jgi:hypothetical protein